MEFADVDALVSFAVKASLPKWQKELYKKYRRDIQVHSKGELFYKIDRLFPNEQPDSKWHRLLSFEPITRASFWKGVNNIIEIFQNSSYTAEASEETVNYITKHNWDNKNLFSFFLDEWTRMALSEDANGLIVVYPPEYLKDYPETPAVSFIGSEHIERNKKDIVIFISEFESEKDYTLETTKISAESFFDPKINMPNVRLSEENTFSKTLEIKVTRKVLHVFTNGVGGVADGMYRLEQDAKDPQIYNWKFYKSVKPFIPVTEVGGVRGERKEINESFFQGCVPMGNLALLQHSQHTAVNFIFAFPRMSEIATPCDNPDCNFGYEVCEKNDHFPDGKKPCPKCHGLGETSNQTPYKVYLKKVDPAQSKEEAAYINADDVKFYTPEVAILNYSKDEWKGYLEEMERALFIQQIIKTGNVESYKSKEVDLKDKYSFLKRIAKVFYEKMRFVVQCYENNLTRVANEVAINTPFSFAIVSEAEAFEALNNILQSNAPIVVKANQVEMFINKFISQSSPIRKAYNVLKLVDKLLFYPLTEIQAMKSNNVITPDQWAIHAFAYPVLIEMYNLDPQLFSIDIDKVAEKLLTELEKYKPEPVQMLGDVLKDKFAPPQIKPGSKVKIIPGREKNGSHAGKSFTVGSVNGNKLSLTDAGGKNVDGYTNTDITNA